MKKILFIISLIILITLSIYNVTYAFSVDDIMDGSNNFLEAGKNNTNPVINIKKVLDVSDLIYNTLLTIGIIVAMLVAAFLGIKFITSSVEEQAKVKESLIPFIVGCVVVFGAFGIWKLTTNILNGIDTSSIVVVSKK